MTNRKDATRKRIALAIEIAVLGVSVCYALFCLLKITE